MNRFVKISMVMMVVMAFLASGIAMAGKIDGLVLYFSFDEGAGDTLKDLSGNGNNGKIIKGTKWVPGKYGKGIEFDSGSVEVASSKSLEIEDEISMMVWINPKLTGGAWQGLITKGPDGGESFELLLNSAGHLHTAYKFADGSRPAANRGAAGAIKKDTWQHIAVTYKPGDWVAYLDGAVLDKQAGSKSKLAILPNELVLGDEKGMSRFFIGTMDEVAIFNKALSEADVNNFMKTNIDKLISVESQGKLASTWANLKKTE